MIFSSLRFVIDELNFAEKKKRKIALIINWTLIVRFIVIIDGWKYWKEILKLKLKMVWSSKNKSPFLHNNFLHFSFLSLLLLFFTFPSSPHFDDNFVIIMKNSCDKRLQRNYFHSFYLKGRKKMKTKWIYTVGVLILLSNKCNKIYTLWIERKELNKIFFSFPMKI